MNCSRNVPYVVLSSMMENKVIENKVLLVTTVFLYKKEKFRMNYNIFENLRLVKISIVVWDCEGEHSCQ